MINWKKQPRTGHSIFENRITQPVQANKLFNNREALVEGWYPLCRAKELPKGEARSFVILKQRVAVWRGRDGTLRALDAFCPHMGADLGNGQVIGNDLRCYFHHWKFSGTGQVKEIPCSRKSGEKIRMNSYPVREFLNHIWIYAGLKERSPLILPDGLDGAEVHAMRLAQPTLFAHHHVMAAGGIDLQHFATVHGMEIDFAFMHRSKSNFVEEWRMDGAIAPRGWRGKLGRILVGSTFAYTVRVGAGSLITITYGDGQRFLGRHFKLPRLHVLWGCLPLPSGVSKVTVFSLVKKRNGLVGKVLNFAQHMATLMLLTILRDDDVKAFPNMRFQAGNPTPEDRPVLQLIHAINNMPESPWTQKQEMPCSTSPLNIGL